MTNDELNAMAKAIEAAERRGFEHAKEMAAQLLRENRATPWAVLRLPFRVQPEPSDLADLPNTPGIRFIGIDRDGNKIDCVVGLMSCRVCCSAYTLDGEHCYSRLAGWLPLSLASEPVEDLQEPSE